jgi:uncharacterized membrane protein YeaQ/YmgE (transglycosylase-associated protein family)
MLLLLLIGALAGWISGLLVHGTGFGLLRNIAVGLIGVLVGAGMLPLLGLKTTSFVGQLAAALLGAVTFLALLSLLD